MFRRKYLAGLGALAAGSAAAIGTGAFDSVEADRTVTVETDGDAAAYLGMEPAGGPNGDHAETDNVDGNDVLKIDVNSITQDDGEGVNLNAVTTIEDVFVIENQGAEDGAAIDFQHDSDDDITSADAIDEFKLIDESGAELDGTLTLDAGSSESIGLEIVTAAESDISDGTDPSVGATVGLSGTVEISADTT